MPEIESADESVIHLATVAKFDAVLEADVRTQAVPQLVAEARSLSEVTFKLKLEFIFVIVLQNNEEQI